MDEFVKRLYDFMERRNIFLTYESGSLHFRGHKLFWNLKKCEFFTKKLLFLAFVTSEQGIKSDE